VNRLRAAVFDMDGLLVDSEPLWQQAEIEVFAAVGLGLDREDCWRTKGRRVDDTVAYWFSRRPWTGPPPAEIERRLVRRVEALLRAAAVAKAGARHAVDFFRSRGFALGLASSSAPVLIDAVLERLGMRGDFSVTHSAVLEAEGKPHPAVYLSTLARLGVAPAQALALEDSSHGIAAAKAAGMRCIAVPDPASGPAGQHEALLETADVVLRSLEDLDDLVIDALTGGARSGGS
jgi:sugar-phosphatase